MADEEKHLEGQLQSLTGDKPDEIKPYTASSVAPDPNPADLKTREQPDDDFQFSVPAGGAPPGLPAIGKEKEKKGGFDKFDDDFAFDGLQIDDVSSLDDF